MKSNILMNFFFRCLWLATAVDVVICVQLVFISNGHTVHYSNVNNLILNFHILTHFRRDWLCYNVVSTSFFFFIFLFTLLLSEELNKMQSFWHQTWSNYHFLEKYSRKSVCPCQKEHWRDTQIKTKRKTFHSLLLPDSIFFFYSFSGKINFQTRQRYASKSFSCQKLHSHLIGQRKMN